jgi:hypothetical protein
VMMDMSAEWGRSEAAADHLNIPGRDLPVEQITDLAWDGISAALRQSGTDL